MREDFFSLFLTSIEHSSSHNYSLFSLSLVLSFSSKRTRIALYPKKKRGVFSRSLLSFDVHTTQCDHPSLHCIQRERGEENRNDCVSLLAKTPATQERKNNNRRALFFCTHFIHYDSEDDKNFF